MLTPVQQTPLALDPARQQITPAAPVAPPAPQRPADVPVQAGATPQDTFNHKDGGERGSPNDRAFEDRAKAEIADQLRGAWGRLMALKEQAGQALASGNARAAKEAAEEAAEVAGTISQVTGAVPAIGVGAIQVAATQLVQGGGGGGTTSGRGIPQAPSVDVPTILDIARSGLGTAKDVVDTAASIPQHPIEDRRSIDLYGQRVLDAMAGVEAIAAKVSGPALSAATGHGHVDLKA